MAVNLSPVGGVAAQFFNNNGTPLAGGLLYSYAAGTTTPQATYTSSTGAIFSTNPIVLDSGGRIPSGGEVWLSGGISYKFALYDASSVLIATWDNITGINSNFLNFNALNEVQTATAGQTVFTLVNAYSPGTNTLQVFVDGVNQYVGSTYSYAETSSTSVTFSAGLHVGALVKFTTAVTMSAGTTNASLVTYNPAGTGAVATTVQTKLRESVSVLDFGADSTGATYSDAAITSALLTGARVYFPAGTYKIKTNIVVNSNAYVYGDGPFKSTINCEATAFSGVFLSVRGRTTVENIGLVSNTTAIGTGIRVFDSGGEYSFTGHVKLKNIYISGFAKGLDVNNIFDMMIDQVEVTSCTVGVNIVPSYSASFDSGYFTTITLNKCYIYGCTSYGLFVNPTLVSKCLTLNDTIIEANTGATAQANIVNTNPLVVTDCYFELVPASPALRLASCVMSLRGGYFNGSGGLSLQATSNDVLVEGYYGTSSTDVIYANGTTLQSLRIANSTVPGTSTLNASKLEFVNSVINGTTYRQFSSNLGLTVTDGDLTNTSRVDSIVALKRSVSVTVNANTTTAIFSDVALANTWNSDFTVGTASFLDSYNPGLILSVQCATTGSAQYISVLATNTTSSTITITSKALRVLLFKGIAMAI